MIDENVPKSFPTPDIETEVRQPKKPKRRWYVRLFDALTTLLTIALVLALPLVVVAFVFQSYIVDGPSMETTLHNNDRLIVWKAPRTWARVTGHEYVPNRGDIIIFNENNLSQFGQTDVKQLVKRVVGLPGDHVVVHNGKIMIYNKTHPGGFDPDEALPYGHEHPFPTTSGDIDITLASNEVFVCGDNRINSLDSRAFGPVDLNNVIGKLLVRIYPLGTFKVF